MFSDLLECFVGAFKKTFSELYLNYSYMTRKDALDILNVRRFDEDFSDKSKYDAVGVRFKELYTRNREENGGSPYLQQIIKNAFEYLRNESN